MGVLATRTTAFLWLLLIAACGGGGGGPSNNPPPPPPPTYTVGGSVSGLTGSGLSVAMNGTNSLSISANGPFTFQAGLAGGSTYAVTVATQPSNPVQLCTVSAGSGTIATSNITTVNVTCGYAGRFAYVANNGGGSDSVSAYAINHSTGALTGLAGSPYGAGNTPVSLAIHPNGKFLYVVDPVGMPTNGALSVYSIDNATGVLTEVSGSPFATPTALFQLVIDPTGKFAFTPDFTTHGVSAFTLDANTGAPTLVAGSPFSCLGFAISAAVDPMGKFVFVGSQGGDPNNDGVICAYTMDSSTGVLTPVAGSPFLTGLGQVTALTVDPAGKFVFATGTAGVVAYTLDASSGALTPVPGSPFTAGANPSSVAVDPVGRFLYVGNNSLGSNSQIFGFSINGTTGALAPIAGSPYASGDTPYFVTIDPSGELAYVANLQSDSITVYSVDKMTGALASTGSPLPNGAGTNPRAIAILK